LRGDETGEGRRFPQRDRCGLIEAAVRDEFRPDTPGFRSVIAAASLKQSVRSVEHDILAVSAA